MEGALHAVNLHYNNGRFTYQVLLCSLYKEVGRVIEKSVSIMDKKPGRNDNQMASHMYKVSSLLLHACCIFIPRAKITAFL